MNIPVIGNFIDPANPITWAIVGILVIVFVMKRRNIMGTGDDENKPRAEDQTRVFVHDDQGYDEKFGDTFSGNVSYGTGAFLKKESCASRLFYGRPRFKPHLLSSRKQTTIYTTRFGDASPLEPYREEWEPDIVDKDTFNDYRSIAVEREYSRGRLAASESDAQQKLMLAATVAVIVLGIATWTIALILPLTPLAEKA